jgi:hypothetical protein
MNLFDGTCRGNDAGRLVDYVEDNGPQIIEALCRYVSRGTRYVRSLIEECDKLVVVSRTPIMLDWVIDLTEAEDTED